MEWDCQSTPPQEKIHTMIKGMMQLSKCLPSDIQSGCENYLDNFKVLRLTLRKVFLKCLTDFTKKRRHTWSAVRATIPLTLLKNHVK